jgi:hypothetical protein
MDKATLAVLTSDIEGQMDVIGAIFGKLEERAADLDPDDERQLESVAYQLHNLYNAIEDLFKLDQSRTNKLLKEGVWLSTR